MKQSQSVLLRGTRCERLETQNLHTFLTLKLSLVEGQEVGLGSQFT